MSTKERTVSDFLRDVLKLMRKYKDYIDIYNNRVQDLNNIDDRTNISYFTNSYNAFSGENLKNRIIGGLPKLLLSKKYFPTNSDIDRFARKYLKMDIPSPEKKSREELIGRVISKIAGLKKEDLKSFNTALNAVLNKADSGRLGNFFLEWDKAIKNIKQK
mgnify:FL=1